MAISTALYKALQSKTGWSAATISRKADALRREHGPMTPDEARYIIAHERGIDLRKSGVAQAEIEKVQALRASGATLTISPVAIRRVRESAPAARAASTRPRQPTLGMLFDSRSFHPAVATSSRKLFVNGHPSDAIRKAFVAVNNRVRKMGAISDDVDDGQALMGEAFKEKQPALQMTDRKTTPEKDEHAGLRFLAMGGMRGMRNPRSHDDQDWWTDSDVEFVLEALALASLQHRCLDHCQDYKKRTGTT